MLGGNVRRTDSDALQTSFRSGFAILANIWSRRVGVPGPIS